MQKVITIVVVVLLVLGFGFFLFKISPQEQQQAANYFADFDLSQAKPGSAAEPLPLGPEDHILGATSSKNTLIAYEDFQCPACAVVDPLLNQAVQELTDTKLVYRHYPLSQHKNAVAAAYAAEAAGAQGKFWEMHDALFATQDNWAQLSDPVEEFAAIAQQVGVANIEQFKTDITSKKFKDRVQRDLVDSVNLSLGGTPSLFFNGKPIQTSSSIEGLKAQVEPLYIK